MQTCSCAFISKLEIMVFIYLSIFFILQDLKQKLWQILEMKQIQLKQNGFDTTSGTVCWKISYLSVFDETLTLWDTCIYTSIINKWTLCLVI